MREETSSSDNSQDNKNANILSSNVDLAAVLLSTFVVIALIFLPYSNVSVFRQILSIIIVIFNPGYALTAALFPRKHDVSNIERVTLAFGLSIAIVPLLALVLAYSGPIALGSIVGVLTLVIISCSIIGLLRRRNLAPKDRFTVEWSGFRYVTQLFPQGQSRRDRILSILLVVSLLLSVSVVVYAVITPAQSDTYTEFYILNSNGTAGDYPTQFSLANATPIIVGVVNHEGRAVTYDLVIAQNESSQLKTLHSEQFVVNDNGQWEKTILLRPDAAGSNIEFEFLLYEQGNTTSPYRETHLFANVTK
jgi:uncharacterized membrane protein